MNSELIEKCNLLINNHMTMRNVFYMSGDQLILAASSMLVGMNMEADLEKLKECEKIIKSKTGVFSEYRGHVKLPLICKMAVLEDPEKYFEAVCSIFEQMKDFKWIDSDFKVIAAMIIYDHVQPDEFADAIAKTVEMYKKMKEDHPWLTSGNDIPFAAMLAVSDIDQAVLSKNIEECYQILKEDFYGKDGAQSLSFVLAADKAEINEKCQKVKQLFYLLREKDHKYGWGSELAVLGALCGLDLSVETIVDEIIEADEFLKKHKGYGDLGLGAKTRRMYAALMVMDAHMPPASNAGMSLVDNIISLTISMEICMMMIMTSMCVTVSAGH